MKKEHLILGAIAIVGGYFAYKHFSKQHESNEVAKGTQESDDKTSNFSGSPKTLTQCTCKNGLRSVCASGDCSKCCGSYGFDKNEAGFKNRNFGVYQGGIFREAPYKRSEIIPQF